MFTVVIHVRVRPGCLEEFEAAILKNARASVEREEHCSRFDVLQSLDDPLDWVLYEEYTDRAAFDAHHRQPHFLEWNLVAGRLLADKSAKSYQVR